MNRIPKSSDLPEFDMARRRRGIRAALDEAGIDILIVTSAVNIRYLTGFTGSAGILVVGPVEFTLVTDGRYAEQAFDEIAAARTQGPVVLEVVDSSDQSEVVAGLSPRGATVGLEAAHVSWARARTISTEWLPHCSVLPTSGLVEELRRVKDAGEVARIATAARIVDRALAEVVGELTSGRSERDIARLLDRRIVELGAEGTAFDTIVASGPNAARPHHRPSERIVGASPATDEPETVIIDVGATVQGYRSDMTRTFLVGVGGPTASTPSMYDAVLAANTAGVDAVRPGVTGRQVDTAARSVIEGEGMGDLFVHGVGHGVGLDIHEAPMLRNDDRPLREGEVVTVEPGVYRSGLGGVRIEDTVVVTSEGCEILTSSPRDPDVT